MSFQSDLSDLNQRLDDLERRLAEKESAIAGGGAVPARHQERIDEIYAKAKASREKLHGSKESTWEAAKIELEADWASLLASFQEWIAEIDEDYGKGQG